MVESSKILTVSYGTFSCTLEGFDDSFGTMKAIAEYFRDLAERDRYFGAEPPTPDAEMLTRIAEREIERRVEARMDESGIVLRASGAAAAAAPIAAPMPAEAAPAMPPAQTPPAEAPDMAAVAEAEVEAETDETADVTPEEVEAPVEKVLAEEATVTAKHDEEDIASSASLDDDSDDDGFDDDSALTFEDMMPEALSEVPAHPDPDSVAAKLQRIRAVVGKGTKKDESSERTDANAPFVADGEDEEDATTEATAEIKSAFSSVEASADEVVEDSENAEDTSSVRSLIETIADEQDDVADAIAEVAEEEVAPVAEDDVEDTLDAFAEEEAAAEELAEAAEEEIAAEAAEEEVAAEPAEEEVAAEAEELSEEADEFAEAAEEVAAEADEPADSAVEEAVAEADAEEAPVAETDEATEDEAPARQSLRARILRVARPIRPASMNGEVEDAPEPEDDTDLSEAEDTGEGGDVESLIARVRSARIKKDVAETPVETAADAAPQDEVATAELSDAQEPLSTLVLDDSEKVDDLDAAVQGSLSAEEEAELQEELAEVEREVAEEKSKNRAGRAILPENDDAAMSRILDRADAQLSEPEGSRRRNAIAQLKAAVAATEAARQLGDKSTAAEKAESDFRKDLDEVVRPRPASSLPKAEIRTERPRPAPLKLVAAQRIDAAKETAPAEPVQPRRVALSPATETDASNFAEFAAKMGATELEDLLEAAAAYTAYVEGIEDFSRPQIMKKVQATSETGFSREDSLRSFGTLLRQGRINKVSNGRFQISDQTRFKPEQKAG